MEKGFIVSTEISGFLGKPSDWQDLYGFLWQDPSWKEANFLGFEMIGFGVPIVSHTANLLKEAKEKGIHVAGIHGRIGCWPQNLLLGFINLLILSTPKLARDFGQEVSYLLFHDNELRDQAHFQTLVTNKDRITLVFVENGESDGGIAETVNIVKKLNEQGVKTGVMFDLAHALCSHSQDVFYQQEVFNKFWPEVLAEFEWLIRQSHAKGGQSGVEILGTHIPIGLNKNDSLPVDWINDEEWQKLAHILEKGHVLRVIENSVSGRLIYNFGKQREYLRNRNIKLLSKLRENGVI